MTRAHVIAGVLLICSGTLANGTAQRATSWAAADELFQKDPRWAGGDGVSSVTIDDGLLWFFADSFVRRTAGTGRANSVMVRNSIGVQRGFDPAHAQLQFHWREGPDGPASHFPEENGTWFWPGSAVQLDSVVLLFLMQVRQKKDSTSEIFSFEVFDWQAVVIRNPSRGPAGWSELRAKVVPNSFQVIVGSAGSLLRGDYLYAYGAREPGGNHAIYLTRWPLTKVGVLDLSEPEWWCGPAGWVTQSGLVTPPVPVFHDGQTELTVHFDDQIGKYVATQTVGFGSTQLGFRFAEKPEGPWSPVELFFRPPESDNKDLFVYAGKAHPAWKGADLVVTYVANAWDFWRMAGDPTVYFPRVVRVPQSTIEYLSAKLP